MPCWKKLLDKKKLLITDGGWETELRKFGTPASTAPELWNRDAPDQVRLVAHSYVQAGADIILTNTFGGNRFKLAENGLSDCVSELNELGVAISREVAGNQALVFASMGPTGKTLAPLGNVTRQEMISAFSEQVSAFQKAGADGIVIETMSDLTEAKAALRAVHESSNLPVVACMTFVKRHNAISTMTGIGPERAAEELEAAGADIVGTNCGSDMPETIEAISRMRSACSCPIWAKPNARSYKIFNETPEQAAQQVSSLAEAGACIIGGCCGITPEHIASFNQIRNSIIATLNLYFSSIQESDSPNESTEDK